jgi:hypothetical protein
VWVADPAAQDVTQINPATGALVDKIPVYGEPGASSAAVTRSGSPAPWMPPSGGSIRPPRR